MPIRVKQSAAEWAARVREDVELSEHEEPMPLKKVSFRLPEETLSLLDYLSSKLRMSRSAVAEELLMRAVEEAVIAVGLPTEEDGFELSLSPPEMEDIVDRALIAEAIEQASKDFDALTNPQISAINKQPSVRQKRVARSV